MCFVTILKSLENKTTITSSMSLTYLLRLVLYLRPIRQTAREQIHENIEEKTFLLLYFCGGLLDRILLYDIFLWFTRHGYWWMK